jgi:hypothetical protein
MTTRAPLLLAVLAGFGLACGPEPEPEPVQLSPDVSAPVDLGGTYQVKGVTVELESGSQREIAGTVIFSGAGAEYRSSFELATTMPGPDGPHHTDVIGTGEGVVDAEGVLRGTARTQLVIGAVAGVPTQFPFVPRYVGPRVVSETVTIFRDDGSIGIEIETVGEAGEAYRATRTTLSGTLVPGSETVGAGPN